MSEKSDRNLAEDSVDRFARVEDGERGRNGGSDSLDEHAPILPGDRRVYQTDHAEKDDERRSRLSDRRYR